MLLLQVTLKGTAEGRHSLTNHTDFPTSLISWSLLWLLILLKIELFKASHLLVQVGLWWSTRPITAVLYLLTDHEHLQPYHKAPSKSNNWCPFPVNCLIFRASLQRFWWMVRMLTHHRCRWPLTTHTVGEDRSIVDHNLLHKIQDLSSLCCQSSRTRLSIVPRLMLSRVESNLS